MVADGGGLVLDRAGEKLSIFSDQEWTLLALRLEAGLSFSEIARLLTSGPLAETRLTLEANRIGHRVTVILNRLAEPDRQ